MALTVPLPDEKRAAIAAALLSGSSVRAASRDFGVAVSSVSRIKADLASGVFQEAGTQKKQEAKQVAREEKRAGLESLIGDYLSQLFVTLKAQAIETAKPDYIFKQNAQDLAILHGVMSDKAIRILEAAAGAQKIEAPKEISK